MLVRGWVRVRAWAARRALALSLVVLSGVWGAPAMSQAMGPTVNPAMRHEPVPADPRNEHAHARGHAPEHRHETEHDHDAGSTPQALAERQRLLDEGENRLRAGDAEGARQAFEQAALHAHEARIELGILRAQMQAGDYRHALAFAAHTAGVHLDEVQGRVFYAWLLNLGGQEAIAAQTLAQAEATAPDHPMVQAVRRCVQSGRYAVDGVLLSTPARLASFASGAATEVARARGARVVSSALLLADGRHALAPQSVLPASGAIWLRNGLGQTVAAEPDPQDATPGLGLVLLKLAEPLPTPGAMVVPVRDAFPGSPAYALDYAPDAAGEAAWPVMRLGFLGALTVAGSAGQAGTVGSVEPVMSLRRLGVALPGRGPRGGPVYDQGGRLVGLALGGEAADSLIPVGALMGRFGERFGKQDSTPRPLPLAPDELYEQAMKASLQVLVEAP